MNSPPCINYTCTIAHICAREFSRDLKSRECVGPFAFSTNRFSTMYSYLLAQSDVFRREHSAATIRRPTTVAPIFTMPRSQLRDQAGRCNRLPTVAPYIVTLRFVSLIDRERNREFLPRFRAVIAKTHARRVGQVETDKPDLPTAYWQKSPSLHETAR